MDNNAEGGKWGRRLVTWLHVGVIALSVVLIVLIGFDTLKNISFLADKTYLRVQFWICLYFILDVAVDFLFSKRRGRFLITHLAFLLISIPYLNIISALHVQVSPEAAYVLRFVPMIRAAYVLAIVSGAMQHGWARSMFSSYIVIVLASLYFGSMMFYVEEHAINPGVKTYWDSLWWAVLNLTTVGCDINPITATGKVLAVMLSAEGLILFPLFTVYLTNILSTHESRQDNDAQVTTSSPTHGASGLNAGA